MVSMLDLLDLNMRLINSTLGDRVSDYPFLAPTLEGTGKSIESLDSVLLCLGSEPQLLTETGFTNESLNESLQLLNESLKPPQQMMDAANSTLGQGEETAEILGSMYESVKLMVSSAD